MFDSRLEHDIKSFLSDSINRLTVILIIFGSLLSFGLYKTYNAVIKAERKTDFRYFNTTRSLEDINNVKINTKDGSVIHRITPNQ